VSGLFERYLDLSARRGRSRGLVLCAFHADHTPSLNIDLDRGLFYCHGCGVGGGAHRFAELVGERVDDRPPVLTRRARTWLEEARAIARAQLLRSRALGEEYRDSFVASDFLRRRTRFVRDVRRLACAADPGSATAWAVLALAASVETTCWNIESEMNDLMKLGEVVA
jgi:hypothetical protein